MAFNGPIGDLIEFSIGGGWGSVEEKSGYSEVAVIRGTDIPKVAMGDFSTVPRRFESNKKITNRLLKAGDVVLETAGGSSANGQFTGRTLLITEEILSSLGPTICASFCKRLALDTDLVEPGYFYWHMQDLYSSGRVAIYDSQSTGISNFQFASFLESEMLELPDLATQKTLADSLSNLNELINLKLKIAQSFDEIAQTIFKAWFIDFEPVKLKIAGEKPVGMNEETAGLFPNLMEDSEIGTIPHGWAVRNLGDVCNIKQGKYLSPSQMADVPQGDDVVPVIGGNGILGYTSKSTFDFDVPLVTCRGSKCGLLQWANYPTWVSNNAMAITMQNSSIYSLFLYLYFKQANFDNVITGSAQPQITVTNLGYMRIVVPPDAILRAFSDATEQMRVAAVMLNSERQTLGEIRDLLLPRLISGELQIPEEMLVS
jgi:type I restriction enzyme S subunit